MSSEIVADIDTMALAERAWHGFGRVVGRTMSYTEAPALAGLDWTVSLRPVTTVDGDGQPVELPDHRAVVRDDTGAPLGVVGRDFHPHQPADVLELARLTVDAVGSDAQVETLGSLRGSRIVFATIALPGDVTIAGDVHLPRLVWATGMDGTLATRAVSTMVRAVCANTLRASFRSARTTWSARHTASLAGRAGDVRHALRLAWSNADSFAAEVDALCRQHVDDADAARVLTGLWPDNPDAGARARTRAARARNAVSSLYRDDDRVAAWYGTAWGLLQAVNTWEQWHAPTRTDRGERTLVQLLAGTRTRTDRAAELLALAA
jgi:phage/plasmid-like protein (TIGR03299 family)